MRLLTLTAAALLAVSPPLRADDRKPPPDDAAQAKAEKTIKDLFKEDFAKRKAADLQELAAKLIKQAGETADDPAGVFVLLRLAQEAAAKAGDAADALQAIDAQAKQFAVNVPALKAKALDGVLHATGAQPDYQAVLDAGLPAAEEAQAADDFDVESRLLRVAQSAAQKLGNKPLATAASERNKLVDGMQKEYDNVKPDLAVLKDKPGDPDASLHVGRFLCFFKGEWEKGLPLLAQCSDAKLKELAKKDLNGPTAAADQAALADAWLDAAEADLPGKTQIQLHAQALYKQAVGQLAGLDKAKVEKKIKDLDEVAGKLTVADAAPEPGWVVLFRSADPRIWDPPDTVNVGKNGYAIPLSKAPDGIQFLKLKLTGTNRYVIIPMTNDDLKKQIEYDAVAWNGVNNLDYHGYHLGIYTLPLQGDFPRDNVVVYYKTFAGSALGWGFGHRIHRDDFQGYSWAGAPLASAVFEISVKAGPLTDAEAKVLLTKKP